jgi:hypothetical protein
MCVEETSMPISWLMSELFWSAVSGIFTAVGSIAILFAIRELRFSAWLKAQEMWNADSTFRQARARVFQRLDALDTPWSKEDEDNALDVCRRMDEFAGLIPYLPKKTALRVWGVPFAKAWLV